MKQEFLKKDGKDRLILLFTGWGTGKSLFASEEMADSYDVLLCSDYRSLDFDFSLIDGYGKIRLAAWSLGVWVASSVFSGCSRYGCDSPVWENRIAVNGTMFPVDDTKGIPESVFEGTLGNMSDKVLARFDRRMCGRELGYFRSLGRERDIGQLRDELAFLGEETRRFSPEFGWTLAVAGEDDLIFPYRNQLEAWEGTPLKSVPAPHYSRALLSSVLSEEYMKKV